MTIYLASDHAGFDLKKKLEIFLKELEYKTEDLGNNKYEKFDDYPKWVSLVADKVAENPDQDRGIILGGSGQGEAMAANRVRGVRAAVYYGGPVEIIKLSREHNDANVLSLGARFLSGEEAKEAVKIWLETPFSKEERHKRRITEIDL